MSARFNGKLCVSASLRETAVPIAVFRMKDFVGRWCILGFLISKLNPFARCHPQCFHHKDTKARSCFGACAALVYYPRGMSSQRRDGFFDSNDVAIFVDRNWWHGLERDAQMVARATVFTGSCECAFGCEFGEIACGRGG